MTDSSIDLEANARVRADDRGHVFHSWSAQALIDPHPVAGEAAVLAHRGEPDPVGDRDIAEGDRFEELGTGHDETQRSIRRRIPAALHSVGA